MRRIHKLLTTALCLLIIPGFAFAKSYVIGNLMGQFGNQMFIIAATTSLALDHNATPVFPDLVSSRNPEWNIAHNYKKAFYHLNAKKPKIKKKKKYSEPHFHYNKIPYQRNLIISGYFQSEKYFKHHKQEIIDLLSPHPEIVDYLYSKYSDIIDHPNTVSIHIRSYLNEGPSVVEVYPTYGVDYIAKAIKQFPEDSLFVVFSNNMKLCKKELAKLNSPPQNIRFIEGEDYIDDFYLMSLCKHNIICNSSFSWWAAYLNRNPEKKVIAPSPWFKPNSGLNTKDLIPPEWTVLHD